MAEPNSAYMKFIKGKSNSHSVIKSENSSWNTLAAIYRMLYLKNNYCLYENDRILFVAEKDILIDRAQEVYDRLQRDMEFDYLTLLSLSSSKVEFSTMDKILDAYFKEYASKSASILRLVGEGDRNQIIRACIKDVGETLKGIKLIKSDYLEFFADEISWMKSSDFIDEDTYQNCSRSGRGYKKGEGPARLLKNSKNREAVYKIYRTYQEKLQRNNLADIEDREKFALEETHRGRLREYTHLIIDDARTYTKTQHELIRLLKDNRSYGETLYLYDTKSAVKANAFLSRIGRLSELTEGERVKTFYFRKAFESPLLNILNKQETEGDTSQSMSGGLSVENYEFISLKNRREFKFTRDITRKDTIVLRDEGSITEFREEEMRELPVFSSIAAGEPIYMNPEIEDTFYLPQMWVRGVDDHFLLRVKGDSMIGAGIDDGDYVVIKSTPSAQHRDIVAVDLDGSATLKRLWIKDKSALLMPENEKYSPIPIGEDGAHILGIAVGILKENRI